jgi:hypothetical protein
MGPKYYRIASVEPNVVDLTINHDRPEFSVRMPVYEIEDLLDHAYLEMRYRVRGDRLESLFQVSPYLLSMMASGQEAMARLPLVKNPDNLPTAGMFSTIENVYTAVRKLKEFHDRQQWRKLIGQYVRFKDQAGSDTEASDE